MADIKDFMRAARIHATGGADQVAIDTVPVPSVRDGFVRVRIAAAGVNPIDWKLREGMFPGPPLPFTLGQDLAGEVIEASAGFSAGEFVYAMLGMGELGAYADYASVPASALARAPKGLAAETAAAVPMGAITAWNALFDVADLNAGERLLVHGAGGAVGGMAVQLARSPGFGLLRPQRGPICCGSAAGASTW